MTDQVYVNSVGPVAEVEAFITKFKIDDNFRPLARLLRRYSRRLLNQALLDAPAASVAGTFSATKVSNTSFNVTINADVTSAAPILYYMVGTRVGTSGPYTYRRVELSEKANVAFTGMAADANYSVVVAGVNANGQGPTGVVKTVNLGA